jgi:hypothetical protein
MQSQTPTLIVLHLFCRLPISHAQDELQNQHAEHPDRIPRRTTVIQGVDARETLTVGLQQGEYHLGEEHVELSLATDGLGYSLDLSEQDHKGRLGFTGWQRPG